MPIASLPPELAALFAWLARNPAPVDVAALHGSFPEIGWHRFGDWAQRNRALLAAASGVT